MDNKLCPFCKIAPDHFEPGWQMERATLMCPECGTFALVETWNTRPIEDALAARVAELEAEIAALRPWARIGKRAIAEHWHVVDITGDGWINHLRCCGAQAWGETDAVHAPDCPIPALLAQLEADHE